MPRIPRRKQATGQSEELLVGVDGGATKVKVHEILILEREDGLRLDLGPASASLLYDKRPGFLPVPLAQQMLEEERGEIQRGPEEVQEAQGLVWAVVRAIQSVAEQAGRKRLRLGICLPGGKSPDGRGVVVMRNGPRLPGFLAEVERGLQAEGLELVAPIPPLLSDGDACAHGENLALEGLLGEVRSGYYVGGGTGIAEACKLDGQVVGMDALRPWLRKAWQLEDESGSSFEDLVSPRGLNERYLERTQREREVGEGSYPEQRIARGDPDAEAVLIRAAEVLADLILSRVVSFESGERLPRTRAQGRVPRMSFKLQAGTVLERVVIGQQLGRLLADPALARFLREPMEERLARGITQSGSSWLVQHYLEGGALRPGWIQASLLRAAPAIGAASVSLGRAPRKAAPTPGFEPRVEGSNG